MLRQQSALSFMRMPFPPLCHDLAIDCWRQNDPPVENPQEIEDATTGKGDEWR
jgi:hypothetical protein